MDESQTPRRRDMAADANEERGGRTNEPRRGAGRRRLIKAAVATAAGVVAASGVYVRPSVRPLEIPTVHAFSF